MAKVAEGLDYSSSVSRPSVALLKAKGMKFAVRYLSGYASKDISNAEYKALTAAGIKVVLVYEKEQKRPESGKSAGVADAKTVNSLLAKYGLPADAFVFYAVDYETTVGPNITGYFQGINSVRGLDKTGGYGGKAVVTALLDKKLASKVWQTLAWSPSWETRAVMRQVKIGVKYSGWPIDIDVDEAWATDYGQIGGTSTTKPPATPPAPAVVTVDGMEAMIKAMKAYLGQVEHPDGSNYVPVITGWYNTKFHIGTTKFAWCAATITRAAWDCGQQKPVVNGTGYAYVPALFAWAKAVGYKIHTGGIPTKGAVVGYRWDGAKGTTSCDHVGLCEASDGKTFYSIEGNIGDKCQREHRDSKFVSVWFVPDYINSEGAEDMQVVLDLGMKVEHDVASGTADAPTRSSMPYEIEYADPNSMHSDVAKDGTRYPSLFPKTDGAYLAEVEMIFGSKLPDGVYVYMSQYERDTNTWVRDVRGTQLTPGLDHVLVPLQVRMDKDHKYRVDVLNASDQVLKVSAAYLIMYK